MKIEDLKIFLEVAKIKNMNEAAKNLYMSHQNLNKIIKKIEAELDTQLFVRSVKGSQLTPSGEKLFITASQIVKNYDQFLQDLHDAEVDIIKFYTLHSLSTLASTLQCKHFGGQYLSVYKRDFDEITKMIQRGKTGIYFLPVLENKPVIARGTKKHIISTSNRIIACCHQNYIDLYTGKTIDTIEKVINNTAQTGMESAAINIDDIQLRKKLMCNEGFAYTTEYHLFQAEFTEDDWCIFYEVPGYEIEYTLFFNLPDTPYFQILQQEIIEHIKEFFKVQ